MPSLRKAGAKSDISAGRNPLGRSLQLLRWLIYDPRSSWGVRELASALHMAPSSVHRLLGLLEEQGMVQRARANGHYALGTEAFRLAWKLRSKHPLSDAALPRLQQMVRQTGESALLGEYDYVRQQMMFVACVESPQPLRYVVELFDYLPVHAGASGLAILAFLPEREQDAILSRAPLLRVTDQTLVEEVDLRRELASIRRRGYAISRGQRIPGAVGIAAPIWSDLETVIGDVVLTVPEQRFKERAEQRLVVPLLNCAKTISEDLGFVRKRTH